MEQISWRWSRALRCGTEPSEVEQNPRRWNRALSGAQDIGFLKERYPDVAQILGLVKAFPPHPSARCHKARLRRRRPHCSIVQTCMPTNESGIEQNTKSTKLVWTFIRWRQAEEMII